MKMQSEQEKANAGKRYGWLAAAAAFLVIAICVTVALLASILKEHVTDDADAIALVPSHIENSAINTVAQNENDSNLNETPGDAYASSEEASTETDETTSSSTEENKNDTTSQSTSQSITQSTNSSSGNSQTTVSIIEEPVDVELNPDITVYDDVRTWETETKVDIFKISYENGEAVVTVDGMGDKVIAPGTGNEYTFYLKNTGDVELDYTLEIEAFFSDGSSPIPVEARLKGYDGTYLLGADDKWADVLELNRIKEQAGINVNCYAYYTLEWQWPFEGGDDVYDTFLGNAAVNEDLTLTIVIHTTATGESMTTEFQRVDSIVKTGDNANLLLWAGLAVGAFLLILFLVLSKKSNKKRVEQEKTDEED